MKEKLLKLTRKILNNMPQISIGPENWLSGVASNHNAVDGGFSPLKKGHNINLINGALSPQQMLTTKATISQTGIAFSMGGNLFASFSTPSGVKTLTIRNILGDALSTSTGKSYEGSMIFNSESTPRYFLAGTTDINLISSAGVQDATWWTVTKGKSALSDDSHYFAQIGTDIYFNDGNKIHKIASDLVITESVYTAPANKKINTICAHKGALAMSVIDITDGNQQPKLYIWDLNESGLLDVNISAPGKILAFASYNGSLYCFTDGGVYEYNGLGFVKKTSIGTYGINQNRIVEADGVLYFIASNDAVSRKSIMAFDGIKFWYPYESTYDIDCLGVKTQQIMFSSNGVFYYLDIFGTASTGQFSTLPIDFIYNSYIDEVIIEFTAPMGSGNTNTFKIYNEKGTEIKELVASFATHGASKSVRFKDLSLTNLNSIYIQGTFVNAIRRITVVYRPNAKQPY